MAYAMKYLTVQSNKDREILEKRQQIFRTANLHSSSQAFRESCRAAFDFYNGGLGQWMPKDIQTLLERGQLPITVNFTQRFVDSQSGVEIQSRYRTAYRSDSQHEEDEEYTETMSHLGFRFQEKNSVPYLDSLKFRDGLICGIGWTEIYKCKEGYIMTHVNPMNVIPDPDDLTPQYTNSRYQCRKRWIHPSELRKFRVNPSDIVGDAVSSGYYQDITSAELLDRESNYTDTAQYIQNGSNRILLIEVQDKVDAKAYKGLDRKGHQFETFDLEMAEIIADSKKDIEEFDTTRIMRTMFVGDHLLEHKPLDPDFPNPKEFSHIPFVWKRAFRTGVPYGIVQAIESIQRDSNARVTSASHAVNSERLILEDNILEGKNIAKIREDMRRKSSVIVLPKDSKYQYISNAPLSEAQISIVEQHFSFAQRILGINDEMMGIETNATSAVSQNVRQISSVRNNVFAFDALSEMKKREAEYFLKLVQASYDENLAVRVKKEDQSYFVALNVFSEDAKGEPIILHNVNNIPMSVYVEEVPDYKSSREESAENLNAILSNPNGNLFVLSPSLLKRLNVQDGEQISKEMIEAMKTKMMIESGQLGMQEGGQQPPEMGAQAPMQQIEQGRGIISPEQLIQGGV